MIFKICQEFNPECIVLSCCSQRCNEYYFYLNTSFKTFFLERHICPICGHNRVRYNRSTHTGDPDFKYTDYIKLYLSCLECKTLTKLSFGRKYSFDHSMTGVDCSLDSLETIDELQLKYSQSIIKDQYYKTILSYHIDDIKKVMNDTIIMLKKEY